MIGVIDMQTFKFKSFGGYEVTFDQNVITIHYAGQKKLFSKAKPRTQSIALGDLMAVDFKEPGKMQEGFVRFLTPRNEKYLSSVYMARHDADSFIVELDEWAQVEKLFELIRKRKNVAFNKQKMM